MSRTQDLAETLKHERAINAPRHTMKWWAKETGLSIVCVAKAGWLSGIRKPGPFARVRGDGLSGTLAVIQQLNKKSWSRVVSLKIPRCALNAAGLDSLETVEYITDPTTHTITIRPVSSPNQEVEHVTNS